MTTQNSGLPVNVAPSAPEVTTGGTGPNGKNRLLSVLLSRSTVLTLAALLLILYFQYQSGGLFIPVEAYPAGLRLVSYLLPLRYGVSAPARLLVDFNLAMACQLLTGQIIWTALLGLLVWAMFRKGVRRVHVNGG